MTDFNKILDQLGLAAYSDSFIEEGFDSWETLCDITESDLNDLHVKLGHRRKLQRAIAEYLLQHPRPVDINPRTDQSRASGTPEAASSPTANEVTVEATPGSTSASRGRTKRKYRRRPKPDLHAPERPASAYVLFTNHVREELKDQSLSFSEIAKIVGERWQSLASDVRDQYEREAQSAKDRYLVAVAAYKRTAQYEQYQRYLADFKAKQASKAAGEFPLKLKPERSASSHSSNDHATRKRTSYPLNSAFSQQEAPSESYGSISGRTSSQPSPAVDESFANRIPSPHRNEGFAPLGYDPVRSIGVTKYSPPQPWDSATGQSSPASSNYSHPVQFAAPPAPYERRPYTYMTTLSRGQTWPEHSATTSGISRSPPAGGKFGNLLDGGTPLQDRSLPPPSIPNQHRSEPIIPGKYDSRIPSLQSTQSAPVPLERGEDNSMPNPRTQFSLAALLRAGEIAAREEEPRGKPSTDPP